MGFSRHPFREQCLPRSWCFSLVWPSLIGGYYPPLRNGTLSGFLWGCWCVDLWTIRAFSPIRRVPLPFTTFEKTMLQLLRVAPSQISLTSWGSLRAFDLVMRNFNRPSLSDLFLYLFDIVRNTTRDSRRMRQGFIDLLPSSSENLFAPYMVDGFANRFVLVRPLNLVSLQKISSIYDRGGLCLLGIHCLIFEP